MNIIEKTKERKYVYRGKIINVRNDTAILPNNNEAAREVVEHPGGACILALTERNEVLLVSQFRYPYAKIMTELPAGKLEKNTTPFENAQRELKEETGASAGLWYNLGRAYPTPGYSDEIIYLFAAKDLSISSQQLDFDEFVNVIKMPYEAAVAKAASGELSDAKTAMLILRYNTLLQSNKLNEKLIELK